MKKGFTLLEVLLSVSVMATGVLSVVILYSLGFRETKQSREDIASAAYADAVMAPLVNAISATNLKWSVFRELDNYPSDSGWGGYFDSDGNIKSSPDGTARTVFSTVMGRIKGGASGSFDVQTSWPSGADGGLKAGLIVMHEYDSAIVKIGFRACRNPSMLMSAPLYYTEVRFQGDPEK